MTSLARREVSCDRCTKIAVVGLTDWPEGWEQLKDARSVETVFDLCEYCTDEFEKFMGQEN